MGVKIRERAMADGSVRFLIDVYHKDYGHFLQDTGERWIKKTEAL